MLPYKRHRNQAIIVNFLVFLVTDVIDTYRWYGNRSNAIIVTETHDLSVMGITMDTTHVINVIDTILSIISIVVINVSISIICIVAISVIFVIVAIETIALPLSRLPFLPPPPKISRFQIPAHFGIHLLQSINSANDLSLYNRDFLPTETIAIFKSCMTFVSQSVMDFEGRRRKRIF